MDKAAKTTPDSERLMAAIDATWPPAEIVRQDDWVFRRGAGGGKRVSATSGHGNVATAETTMETWNQSRLFRLIPDDIALDGELAERGYTVVDPVVMYAAPVETLLGSGDHTASVYSCAFRPAVIEEIWAAGGIGPDRLAIMDRAVVPKTTLLSRADDIPCAVAFAAVDGDVAMIHAIEVLSTLRRKGAGRLLLEGAARFAAQHNARWLALAVTEENVSARALYDRAGMTIAGRYHYRIKPETF